MASRPTFTLERPHPAPVVGVDEAGRGPLAGPVVAAAVSLDRRRVPRGIDDSKKLCAEARADLAGRLRRVAAVGVGLATVEEIDRLNIYWATMLAMTRAVEALCAGGKCEPAMVLVDGNALPRWRFAATAIVSGDARCLSIAAASIVAKHERDTIMLAHDAEHPGYGWAANKGYATPDHRAALDQLGPTPLHRRSFAPVAQSWARRAPGRDQRNAAPQSCAVDQDRQPPFAIASGATDRLAGSTWASSIDPPIELLTSVS